MVRRIVIRHACLAIVETLRMVSGPVKKRFPTYNHLVEAGLMTEDEKQAILNAQSKSEYLAYVYWMPLRKEFESSFHPQMSVVYFDFT